MGFSVCTSVRHNDVGVSTVGLVYTTLVCTSNV